jgi:hypothetical protein
MQITAREAYIDILTELVKEEAPTLYMEDYLYYFNKAISEYMKTRYELFETNQQLADDMRAWKKTFQATSLVIPIDSIHKTVTVNGKVIKAEQYRHLLSCVIAVTIDRPITKCDQRPDTTVSYKVTRMSSEIKAGLLGNKYLEAKFYRPYFEIIDNTIKINVGDIDPKRVKISSITIEYLSHPKLVNLEDEDIEVTTTEDPSEILEFSKEVGEEIIKVALKLILERGSNPRLQSNMAVNQSISDVSTGLKGGR